MLSPTVICALGNPGDEYDGTRHNVGFDLADAVVSGAGASWSRAHPDFHLAHARLSGHDVVAIKPQTYMNLSGEAIQELSRVRPVRASDLLVVCDDIALPLGLIRLRKKGSDGGHNGLKSIIETLGTTRFARLRLGVGPVPEDVDAADFVLAPMTEDDRSESAKMVREALKCVRTMLEHGLDTAMNRFNRRAEADAQPEE